MDKDKKYYFKCCGKLKSPYDNPNVETCKECFDRFLCYAEWPIDKHKDKSDI